MRSHLCCKGCENISKNKGKKFEEDINLNVPENCWIYRLRDTHPLLQGELIHLLQAATFVTIFFR